MNRVDSYRSSDFPQGEEGQIEQTLPFEIIKNILFFLDDTTLQSAGTTCRRWSQASVGAAEEKKLCLLKIFTRLWGKYLNKKNYGNQIKQLEAIDHDTTLYGSKNLAQVKSSFLKLTEKCAHILKNLKKTDLKALREPRVLSKDQPVLVIYEEIVYLATLYKEIDEANAEPVEFLKSITLAGISRKLASAGRMDKAIEIAEKLSFEGKWQIFFELSEILVKKGQIDKAIEIGKLIPKNACEKTWAMVNICDALIRANQFDKAIELATIYLDEYHRLRIYNICITLKHRDQIYYE